MKLSGELADIQMVAIEVDGITEKDLLNDWNMGVCKYGQFSESNPPKYVVKVETIKFPKS
jgi:hypothetical protein